jgi:signal transduction histidine kinase
MKTKTIPLTERYLEVLRTHLKQGSRATKTVPYQLGCEALEMKIQTLDLARIHDLAWTQLAESGNSFKSRAEVEKRANLFFSEVIKPIEETHASVMEAREKRDEQISALRSRTSELLLSNRALKKEVRQRKAAEVALKKSEHQQKILLEESRQRKEQLRYLSHQILLEQEEQRRKISRELHDEIAQILAGINVHLAALKTEAAVHSKGFSRKITNTQRLVEKSVKIVHRFACQLRPTVLDDLGIIPALNTYMKDFSKRTGILIHFRAFAGVEQLNSTKRTVLFRVAQAALANVAQHSRATLVRIKIRKFSDVVCMEIHDDGKSFEVERVLSAKMNEHLGLIGMRERVEMVGGSFSVESIPGQGTTICAEIPSCDSRRSQRLGIRKAISILV